MATIAQKNVHLANHKQVENSGTGGRCGTIRGLTLDQFQELFGQPHLGPTGDGKVTAQWYFATPRGCVSVHDYWWNAPDELSIGDRSWSINTKPSPNAARWAKRYFRDLGLNCD